MKKTGVAIIKEKEVIEQKQMLFDKIVWLSTLLRLAARECLQLFCGRKKSHGLSVACTVCGSDVTCTGDGFDLNRKMLAIESGGRVLKPSTDLVRQIDDCVGEANAFYTLSFDPAPAVNPDEYHDLKVVIASAKARDQSRDSFPER